MSNPIIHWDLVVSNAANGRVLVPRTEIPMVGAWAMFADPDGIPMAILQPAPRP